MIRYTIRIHYLSQSYRTAWLILGFNLVEPYRCQYKYEVVLMHFPGQAKPYTAITVQIERMTKPEYEVEDLSGIVDLIEVIKLQSSGPTEAARAIRKKLSVVTISCSLSLLTLQQ